MAHDLGDLLQRARNSLAGDLAALSAHSSIAGGLAEIKLEDTPPRKQMLVNFGSEPSQTDGINLSFMLHVMQSLVWSHHLKCI